MILWNDAIVQRCNVEIDAHNWPRFECQDLEKQNALVMRSIRQNFDYSERG